MRTEETIYLNRNNIIARTLTVEGVEQTNHDQIPRLQVLIGSTLLDSQVNPELFDLTNTDRVIIKPGGAALTAGRYLAYLIVFDASMPLGEVWDSFTVNVLSI